MDYNRMSDNSDEIVDISDETCRICMEDDNITNLIYPCKCSGSSKYVHHKCLNEWRTYTTNSEYTDRCEICNYTYHIQTDTQSIGWFSKYVVRHWRIYIVINIAAYLGGGIMDSIDTSNKIIDLVISHPETLTNEKMAFLYFLISLGMCNLLLILYILIGTLTLKNKKLYCRLYKDYKVTIICVAGITVICTLYHQLWIAIMAIEYFMNTIIILHIQSIIKVNTANQSKIENYEPVVDDQDIHTKDKIQYDKFVSEYADL
jgi:hypothetical protein